MNEIANMAASFVMPYDVWFWLALVVVFILVEAISFGLTTIWFGGGALAAAAASFFTNVFVLQVLVFAVVTLVLVIITRPLALRKVNKKIVDTNINAIVGMTAVAESDISENEKGDVKVDGKLWTAVMDKGSMPVRRGDTVKVKAVEGVKLIVAAE